MITPENYKETTPDKSLLRKTKAQLIEIIFRKDALERELRKKLKDYNSIIISQHEELDKVNEDMQSLRLDYENICDTCMSKEVLYKKHSIIKNIIITILSFILIINGLYTLLCNML